MPPKKEADGKKKKVAASGSGELAPEDQIKMLKFTIDALQVQLADRSEQTSRALHAKDEVTETMKELSKNLEEEKDSKLDLFHSMTRQINELELELSTQLKSKEVEIAQFIEKSKEIETGLHNEIKSKVSLMEEKDLEIKRLRDELSSQKNEFNASLQVTYLLPSKTIIITNN